MKLKQANLLYAHHLEVQHAKRAITLLDEPVKLIIEDAAGKQFVLPVTTHALFTADRYTFVVEVLKKSRKILAKELEVLKKQSIAK